MIERTLGRLTAWLLRHRAFVLVVWLVPVPLLVMGYLQVASRLKSIVGSNQEAHSAVVGRKLTQFSKMAQHLVLVTYHDDQLSADDAPFRRSVLRIDARIRKHNCTKKLTAWPDLPLRSFFISSDGHTQASLIEVEAGVTDYGRAEQCVRELRQVVRQERKHLALPRLEMLITGPAAIDLDIGVIIRRESTRAEIIVFVVSLFLLIWMFRSGAAAVLPLIIAALSVMSCLSVVYIVANYMRLSVYVSTVATMSGLALGLDYALLYVNRVKEELARGRGVTEAIVHTARTAGKAILGSGTLVMIGFAGLFIPYLGIAHSLALSGILIVFCTLAATLTLLPVLLSLWAPYLDWPRWRWFRASHEAVDRFWVRWSRLTLARPLVPILLGAVIVGAFAPNVFDLKVKNPRHEVIPPQVEARRGVDRVIEITGVGQIYPISCVAELTDGTTWKDPARQRQLIAVLDQIRTWPRVHTVYSADLLMGLSVKVFGARLGYDFGDGFAGRFLSDDDRMVTFDVQAKEANDRNLDDLVERLRRELPGMLSQVPGVKVWVGGKPAMTYEIKVGLVGSLPILIPVVVFTAFLLMAFFFRSVVIPLKAVLLNVLSLSTTFGILVLVFQYGYGLSWLGVTGPPPGALSLITPVILFCILFGVSMDYEVFLVSRIQETYREAGGYDETDPKKRQQIHREAIQEGLSRTGGIITNAALIMVITFAAFVSGSLLPMKEMGFALALAVALDATLVRMMLVPAVLRLVGALTWWWPGGGRPGRA